MLYLYYIEAKNDKEEFSMQYLGIEYLSLIHISEPTRPY